MRSYGGWRAFCRGRIVGIKGYPGPDLRLSGIPCIHGELVSWFLHKLGFAHASKPLVSQILSMVAPTPCLLLTALDLEMEVIE